MPRNQAARCAAALREVSETVNRHRCRILGLLAAVAGLFLASVGGSAPLLAWDGPGHEQIADVAWTRLNAKAKERIRKILEQGDVAYRPYYVPGCKPQQQMESAVRQAFLKASTFADAIRSPRVTTGYSAEIEQWNKAWGSQTDPRLSPRERSRCRPWHYCDLPAPAKSNSVVALKKALAELRRLGGSSRPADLRLACWWLYWGEHLTGDLHQPLHCTGRDRGGNGFHLGIPYPPHPSGAMTLHYYWDQGIGMAAREESAGGAGSAAVTRRWTSASARPPVLPSSPACRVLDPAAWAKESARLAGTEAYAGITPGAVPSAAYRAKTARVSKKQCLLAGYRLAKVLNTALGR